MDRVVGLFLLVLAFSVVLVPVGGSAGSEERREYVGGGSFSGTTRYCTPELPFDILAACDIRCPGGTCNITVIDAYRGSEILFRICFDGETFCRPLRYWGTANVDGAEVSVVPDLSMATKGVVIVR